METLVTIIIYIAEALISFSFFNKNYDKKFKPIIIIIIGMILFVPCSVISDKIGSVILNLITFFIINLAFSIICFKISFKSAFFQSLLLDALMFSTELVATFSLSAFLKVPTNAYENDINLYVVIVCICKLLYFAVSLILAAVIKRGNGNNLMSKHFILLFMFPVLSLASLTVFLFIA